MCKRLSEESYDFKWELVTDDMNIAQTRLLQHLGYTDFNESVIKQLKTCTVVVVERCTGLRQASVLFWNK